MNQSTPQGVGGVQKWMMHGYRVETDALTIPSENNCEEEAMTPPFSDNNNSSYEQVDDSCPVFMLEQQMAGSRTRKDDDDQKQAGRTLNILRALSSGAGGSG